MLEIGSKYMVTWRNGQKHPAEIIEKRPARKASSGSNNKNNQHSEFEYYIHYLH